MHNVHDYEINDYRVDFKNCSLVITIELDTKFKKIVFSDMLAYKFENEIPYSTILDLDKLDISKFFRSKKELLELKKNSGWPLMFQTIDELEGKILENKLNYYVLYASYGMSGWILAKTVSVESI